MLQIQRFIVIQEGQERKMLSKVKKQKQQKLNKQNLRMFPTLLEQPASFMLKIYPNFFELNMLKLITCIHLNYILYTYFEVLQKANQICTVSQSPNSKEIGELKIGIIGGGVMGRFFLNGLLVLQKEGLEPSNIWVSTRQFEDLEFYQNNFQINVTFDNEKLAEQADILIITVPSTLDNWVIADLKQPLLRRIDQSSRTTSVSPTPAPKTEPTMNIVLPNKNNSSIPLVYVTTSNMNDEKLDKLFDFSILTPIVRGDDEKYLSDLVTAIKGMNNEGNNQHDKAMELIENYLVQRILQGNEKLKSTLFFIFQRYFHTEMSPTPSISSYSGRNTKSIETLNKANRQSSQSLLQAPGSSLDMSSRAPSRFQKVKNVIEESFLSNESAEMSFKIRCRKWRMAYNNYIA